VRGFLNDAKEINQTGQMDPKKVKVDWLYTELTEVS
jgi:hypothetical protein